MQRPCAGHVRGKARQCPTMQHIQDSWHQKLLNLGASRGSVWLYLQNFVCPLLYDAQVNHEVGFRDPGIPQHATRGGRVAASLGKHVLDGLLEQAHPTLSALQLPPIPPCPGLCIPQPLLCVLLSTVGISTSTQQDQNSRTRRQGHILVRELCPGLPVPAWVWMHLCSGSCPDVTLPWGCRPSRTVDSMEYTGPRSR